MTATLIERNTDSLLSSGVPPFRNFPVAAAEKILYGTMVLVDGYGRVIEGISTAGGYVGCGVALATTDNTTGAAGDRTVDVGYGVYYFNNSTGDAVTNANLGQLCYVEDNQTVAQSDGGGARQKAGTVFEITSLGQVGVHFSDITAAL